MKIIILAAAISVFIVSGAAFADERLVGTWEWDESYRDEEGGEIRDYSITLIFGADGLIKIESFYYDHGAETAWGNYEADGRTLRVTITEVLPFQGPGESNYEKGETKCHQYELKDDKLVMGFLGGELVFKRTK